MGCIITFSNTWPLMGYAMNWLLFILICIAAYFVQNCIHELSHLFAWNMLEGRKPVKFVPYPHKYRGRWMFARCQAGPKQYFTDIPWFVYIVPFWSAIIWFFIWGLCFFQMLGYYEHVWYFIPFMVCGLLDALFFWYTYLFGSDRSDGKRYKRLRR